MKNKKEELAAPVTLRMPAEWEKHEATWLGYPHNKEDWPGKFAPVPWVFCEMIRKITEGEIVRLIVESKEHEEKAAKALKLSGVNLDKIEFFRRHTNRGWLRDCGPAFIKDDVGISLIDFKFNAWAKYDNYKKDDKIPKEIAHALNLRRIKAEHNRADVVLEGGSIDINGKGTLITTEECLMDPEFQVRNSGFTKKDYEDVFRKYMGITNTIWLGKGIEGDDTHGHVDDLCRFVNEKTLVAVKSKKPAYARYNELNENFERLQDARLEDGTKPEVVELPMPADLYFEDQLVPASYANFYICNSYVLVPTFNDPNDYKALGILSELFKDRPICGIHAVDLVWGLGTIHCLTHEQPAI